MTLLYYDIDLINGNTHVNYQKFTGLEWVSASERDFITSSSALLLGNGGDIHCIWPSSEDDYIAHITARCENEDIDVGWVGSSNLPTQMLRLQNTTFAVKSLFYGTNDIVLNVVKPHPHSGSVKISKSWTMNYSGNQIGTTALDVDADYAAFAWTGEDVIITSPEFAVPVYLYKSTQVHGDAHWQNVNSGVIDGQIYSVSNYVSGFDLSVRDIRCSSPVLLNNWRDSRYGQRLVTSDLGLIYYMQLDNILVTDVRYPTVQYEIPIPNDYKDRYKQGFVSI